MEIVAGEPLGRGFRGGVNRQRVLGFRLGSEFVRVGDRVRKGGPFVWGGRVRPNMRKSASAGAYDMGKGYVSS